MKEKIKDWIWLAILVAAVVVIIWMCGCTHYRVKIGDAELNMTYILQDKSFRRAAFDPNTHKVEIENFGSETSQVAEVLLKRIP